MPGNADQLLETINWPAPCFSREKREVFTVASSPRIAAPVEDAVEPAATADVPAVARAQHVAAVRDELVLHEVAERDEQARRAAAGVRAEPVLHAAAVRAAAVLHEVAGRPAAALRAQSEVGVEAGPALVLDALAGSAEAAPAAWVSQARVFEVADVGVAVAAVADGSRELPDAAAAVVDDIQGRSAAASDVQAVVLLGATVPGRVAAVAAPAAPDAEAAVEMSAVPTAEAAVAPPADRAAAVGPVEEVADASSREAPEYYDPRAVAG